MKRLILVFALIASLLLSIPTSAAGTQKIIDYADILSSAEEKELTTLLGNTSDKGGYDIAIVTVNDLQGKDIQDYADDLYDEGNYGCGSDYSGVLLLICMEDGNRGYHFTTHGKARLEISSLEVEIILDGIYEYISVGDYYNACIAFADSVEHCINTHNDESYSYAEHSKDAGNGGSSSSEDSFDFIANLGIALVIGLIIALIAVFVMKGQLKSVALQSGAAKYAVVNSLRLTSQSDIYLYRTVTRVPIPQKGSSAGRGGGGSHISSSGRTHGGGGRSF